MIIKKLMEHLIHYSNCLKNKKSNRFLVVNDRINNFKYFKSFINDKNTVQNETDENTTIFYNGNLCVTVTTDQLLLTNAWHVHYIMQTNDKVILHELQIILQD